MAATNWDENATEKFQALDKYKKAAALNKELLADNLANVFALSIANVPDREKEFTSAKTHYFNSPSATVIDTPELSLYKHGNPIKCISVNDSGQFVAADTTNKHFVRKPDRSIHCFSTSGPQIKMVKMHEIDNMASYASRAQMKTFNAATDEVDSMTPFNNAKKIFFAPNGKWILLKDYSNKIFLNHNPTRREWQLTRLGKNPTCLASDENGSVGLIGTTDNLFYLTIINGICDGGEIDATQPIPNVDCVDVTPDGQFGLATNDQGFCRISLKENNYPFIGEFTSNLTSARISNCGQFIITGDSQGAIILYKVIDNKITGQSALDHLCATGKITCLALSPDNKTIAAGSSTGLLVASCKKTYDEFQKLSPLQLTALLRLTQLGAKQLDTPLIKKKFAELRSPQKTEYLKRNANHPIVLAHEDAFLCSICSENIVDASTSCNHEFCSTCLQSWQAKDSTCPTCRAPLNMPK